MEWNLDTDMESNKHFQPKHCRAEYEAIEIKRTHLLHLIEESISRIR